jgi:hypothetical protein
MDMDEGSLAIMEVDTILWTNSLDDIATLHLLHVEISAIVDLPTIDIDSEVCMVVDLIGARHEDIGEAHWYEDSEQGEEGVFHRAHHMDHEDFVEFMWKYLQSTM